MKKTGFTLIEIIVSITIIAILTAIALPAYQDYLKRAHVFEGIHLASGVKFSVYEYYYKNGTWPLDNTASGLPIAISIKGNSTNSVSVSNGNVIITYNTKVGNGQVIVFSPTRIAGAVGWSCNSSSTTVPSKYRPANCR